MEFVIVVLVQSSFDVLRGVELDHPLVPPLVVGVGVGHLSHPPHQILEILPHDSAGKVVDDDAVLGPGGGSVPPHPLAPLTPSVALTVSTRSPGVLHDDPGPEQLPAVEIADGVVGVTMIIELLRKKESDSRHRKEINRRVKKGSL